MRLWRGVGLWLCMLLAGRGVWAQTYELDTVWYAVGLRGGAGVSGATFQPHQDTDGAQAYEAGLSFRVHANPYLGLGLEVNTASTTFVTTDFQPRKLGDSAWVGHPLTCSQQWLNLPILLSLQYRISWMSFRALGGCYVDYLLSERVGPQGEGMSRQPIRFSTHQLLGVGACGGAQIGIRTRIGEFALEYRFVYRLTSLYNRERIPKANEPRSNVRYQVLGLAYHYHFNTVKKRLLP